MINKNNALKQIRPRKEGVLLSNELLILPEIYSTYISHYELGTETELFHSLKIIYQPSSIPIVIRWANSAINNPWKIDGDRLLGMTTLEDLKYEIQGYNQRVESWHKSGMIKIGWTHGDVILLGIESHSADKIYLYGESSDNGEFHEIANHVFSMFAKIELVPDFELLDFYKINLEELQKNWNEDFWRVKKV